MGYKHWPGNLRSFAANCNMSRITRLLCYFFGLKFASVLFSTLFPSLVLLLLGPTFGWGGVNRALSLLQSCTGLVHLPSFRKVVQSTVYSTFATVEKSQPWHESL